jgi:FkbM family methyltransferase
MGIKTHVKERVRRLVGTHELNHRQHALEISLERLSAACENSRPERVRTLEDLLQQREAALKHAYSVAASNTVRQASEEAFFRTNLNDVVVDLPRDTIRMYVEILEGSPEGPLNLYLETAHLKWMMSHIVGGGSFLDVGAATGTMTLVMAATFGAGIKIAAFEPARQARRLLERTLERNGIVGVEVLPNAVSNAAGVVAFSEYGYDETCVTPWLPDASAIHTWIIDDSRSVRYDVEATTLDAFCSARGLLNSPTVVKVDVEGFEVHVLEGSLALIAAARPWFSIDIHKDPFGDGTTEGKVRALLGRHGYNFETMRHVLLASP